MTENAISLSFEYALFTHTLTNLGCKDSLNHFRATSLIQNFFSKCERIHDQCTFSTVSYK